MFSLKLKQSGYLKHNLQELLGLFKKIYPNEEAPIEPEEDQTFVTEEYRIPTCSYRMGVPNMAYAVVNIGKNTGYQHVVIGWVCLIWHML